ncbi:epoxide hydrolase 3-like [Wyeomyia smithii]|uniref:epoxide hydrolase 3-like n=1 Tax=Wyeomyia smithii TaxID=174621 RepID=UPI002467FE98|nr:epoxide hydrolase 3-like [Wyeomyia smithii]
MNFARVLQAIVIYAIGGFYAVQFALRTALEFLSDPRPSHWSGKTRPYPPTILSDSSYGRHQYTEVNGVRLHYVENGDREKPLMLFLHGFPEFWFSWHHQLKEFAKDYWVVALDLRGFGDSEQPDDPAAYRIDLVVEDIRGFIQASGHEKAVVIGHGLGATIGFQFVLKNMPLVDRYVMMGGASLKVTRSLLLTSWQQFKMSWYSFFYFIPSLSEFYLSCKDLRYIEQNMGRFLTAAELEAYKYTFSRGNSVKRALNYFRENFSFWRIEERLPKIDIYSPGLYLVAENDQFISMHSAPALVKAYDSLKFRVVPGCGHYMHLESPAVINKMIRDFLNFS